MKNVVLIGASGFVGNALLNELLDRGHQVTAIVRNAQKITRKHDRLSVLAMDVEETEKLKKCAKVMMQSSVPTILDGIIQTCTKIPCVCTLKFWKP